MALTAAITVEAARVGLDRAIGLPASVAAVLVLGIGSAVVRVLIRRR